MRWLLISSLVVGLSGGCTRDNPAFGAADSAPTTSSGDGSGTGMNTTRPDDGPADTNLDDATEPDPTGLSGTTAGETDCLPIEIALEPTQDTFLVSTEGESCGGTPCPNANFGRREVHPLRDQAEGFRAHLLMEFPLGDIGTIDVEQDAELVLFVDQTPGEFQLTLRPVQPEEWFEGTGAGMGDALAGESTWDHASAPKLEWVHEPTGQTGPFDVLLDGPMSLPTPYFGPIEEGGDDVVIPIPGQLLDLTLAGDGVLDLDVTQFTDAFDVFVHASESDGHSPLLILQGC